MAKKMNEDVRDKKLQESVSPEWKVKAAKYLARNSRWRAKRDGLEHTLRWEDLIIPDVCPITEEPFWPVLGQQTPYSITIDRKNANKGYVPDNVWVICLSANIAKRDFTLEQLKRLVKLLQEGE